MNATLAIVNNKEPKQVPNLAHHFPGEGGTGDVFGGFAIAFSPKIFLASLAALRSRGNITVSECSP